MFKGIKASYLLLILALILAACATPQESPEPLVETLVVTEVVEATPVETIHVVTPTPEQEGSRTLVICMGLEVDTLYPYVSSPRPKWAILEAIAEGGWGAFDNNSFAYQPIILEKLPSLADGDASLSVVTVSEGDQVVDANGQVVSLDSSADPPIRLAPAGGGDPVAYQGGGFEMDQLLVTFHLLPGLLWSDGAPLTAEDSVYAFTLLSDPDTQFGPKNVIERTASYETIDELTTQWTGLPGYMDAEYYTRFFGPAPEHVWGKYSAAELLTAEEAHRKPVGWGPYMIDEWVSGERLTLKKNPNYFRSEEGLPRFDRLIFRFVGDDVSANIAALLAGECDILEQSIPLLEESQLLLDLQSSGEINASFTTGTAWEHVDFGIQPREYDDGYQEGIDRPDFFSDLRTRQAFAMCMDRQAVVDTVFMGQAKVLNGYLPPQHPLHNPEIREYEFDVEAGRALLEEVGWVDGDGDPRTPRTALGVPNVPDGTPLVVTYETVPLSVREQSAALLQNSLAECGIQAKTQFYSPSDFFAHGQEGKLFGRDFDLAQFAWVFGVTPPCDLFQSNLIPGPAGETWVSVLDGGERTFGLSGWGGSNNPGFVDEDYDRACNTALNSLPGQETYESAHLEAQRIFAEQLPVLPLYLGPKVTAYRSDLCDLIMDPTNVTELWNIEEFDYGEGCEE